MFVPHINQAVVPTGGWEAAGGLSIDMLLWPDFLSSISPSKEHEVIQKFSVPDAFPDATDKPS